MAIIDTFNSTVSDAINKENDFYKTWIGDSEFTPEPIILVSEDVNCGAICNELEFSRYVTNYYVNALVIDNAEGDELQDLITSFIDLPRRGTVESDAIYRSRFKFLAIQNNVARRTTRSALFSAIAYYVPDISKVQIIENFDTNNLYFEIRFSGVTSTDDALFLNNLDSGFLDSNYMGGAGLGSVITYLGELIQRIKAVGVDFDIVFVEQGSIEVSGTAVIGTVQLYKSSDTTILNKIKITKTANAEIV